MDNQETNKDDKPKAALINIENFFRGLDFLVFITPEDGSISTPILLNEIAALEPDLQEILGHLLSERLENQLVLSLASNLLQYTIDSEILKTTKLIVTNEAQKNKKSIYRAVVYPNDPTPSDSNPIISLQNDIEDFNRLLNALFLMNNAITDHQKVFGLQMIISSIINNLILFEVNPLLILLSAQAPYYLNSKFLQSIIKSMTTQVRTDLALSLKNFDQISSKIFSVVISKDKEYLASLVNQDSPDWIITIDAILDMAIKYGAYFMAEFALEQWLSYFSNDPLTEVSYHEILSLTGNALTRSNTGICSLLTQPKIWNIYREEDKLRLLKLILYRSGNATRAELIKL
jgi:hypothetical protein